MLCIHIMYSATTPDVDLGYSVSHEGGGVYQSMYHHDGQVLHDILNMRHGGLDASNIHA